MDEMSRITQIGRAVYGIIQDELRLFDEYKRLKEAGHDPVLEDLDKIESVLNEQNHTGLPLALLKMVSPLSDSAKKHILSSQVSDYHCDRKITF